MLAGDGVKKDTKSLGVFVVTIHHAVGLAAQDRNGKSDPYIVLAYAKFGKPLYSTRIIQGDLNPVWEETAVLLVTEDEVKGEEDLSAMLWDSDKRTADDLVGRVTIPVVELMKDVRDNFLEDNGCTLITSLNSPARCTLVPTSCMVSKTRTTCPVPFTGRSDICTS